MELKGTIRGRRDISRRVFEGFELGKSKLCSKAMDGVGISMDEF